MYSNKDNSTPPTLHSSTTYNTTPVVELPVSLISNIADAHGYTNSDAATFDAETYQLIARTVEFRIRQIIQEAAKCMRHSCRYTSSPVLSLHDIKNALWMLKFEPCYGYSKNSSYTYLALPTKKADRFVIKREAHRQSPSLTYRDAASSTIRGVGVSMSIDSRRHESLPSQSPNIRLTSKVRVIELIYQDVKLPVPCEPCISIHWMAVYGEVPNSSRNLCSSTINKYQYATKAYYAVDLAAEKKKRKLKINDGSVATEKVDGNEEENGGDNLFMEAAVQVAMRIPHILGTEHLYFFEEVKDAVQSHMVNKSNDSFRRFHKTLHILQTSSGLEQLLPFLIQFFASEVYRQNDENSKIGLPVLLQYIRAIIHNSNIRLHHYLHQIIAPLFEIILKPDKDRYVLVYYGCYLRREAAMILGELASSMRLCNGLLESLDCFLLDAYKKYISDPSVSLQSCYGAVQGILALGRQAVRLLLLPSLPHLLKLFTASSNLVVAEIQHSIVECVLPDDRKQLLVLKSFLLSEIEQLLLKCFYDSVLDCCDISYAASQINGKQIADSMLLNALIESTTSMGERYLPITCAAMRRAALQRVEKEPAKTGRVDLLALTDDDTMMDDIQHIDSSSSVVTSVEYHSTFTDVMKAAVSTEGIASLALYI